jgi:hypothetical protein
MTLTYAAQVWRETFQNKQSQPRDAISFIEKWSALSPCADGTLVVLLQTKRLVIF